jgi:Zn-dependent oligopeptidase
VPRHDARNLCGADKRQGEGTCGQPAGWGTPHPGTGQCKLHGGCMPNNRRAAASERARKEVMRLGFEPVADPLAQLASVAGELVAVKDRLREHVERLTQIRTLSAEGTEQVRAELSAYQQALRDTVSVLAVMARLNIGERMAKVSEAQLELMEKALRHALEDAGLGLEEQDRAAHAFTRHLRAA